MFQVLWYMMLCAWFLVPLAARSHLISLVEAQVSTGPIPNSEVKLASADDTSALAEGKVGRCQVSCVQATDRLCSGFLLSV